MHIGQLYILGFAEDTLRILFCVNSESMNSAILPSTPLGPSFVLHDCRHPSCFSSDCLLLWLRTFLVTLSTSYHVFLFSRCSSHRNISLSARLRNVHTRNAYLFACMFLSVRPQNYLALVNGIWYLWMLKSVERNWFLSASVHRTGGMETGYGLDGWDRSAWKCNGKLDRSPHPRFWYCITKITNAT
jgi:hypothetical protein